MTIWIDAQLSPSLATWITDTLGISAVPVRNIGLRDAKDSVIFHSAREADVIVLTKDVDFLDLLAQHGPPPKVLWLTCGNTSNQTLHRMLRSTLPAALTLLQSGECLVEITGPTNDRKIPASVRL